MPGRPATGRPGCDVKEFFRMSARLLGSLASLPAVLVGLALLVGCGDRHKLTDMRTRQTVSDSG